MLRPYQQRTLDRVMDEIRQGHESIVLVMPTGAGKTEVAVEMSRQSLARSDDADVVFIGHRVELIDQPARRYEARGIPFGIIKAGVEPRPSARVQIASVQTIVSRPLTGKSRRRCLVFVDEGHRTKARTYLQTLDALRAQYASVIVIILTATPYRLDGQGLGDIATSLVEATTPRELISLGFITEGVLFGDPPPRIDPRAFRDGEADEQEHENVMDDPKLIGDTVDTWRKRCGGMPGIGRCRSKKSALRRLERFEAAGLRVAFVDGDTPDHERRLAQARLAVGGEGSSAPNALDVLLFVNVFTEGFDSESSYGLLHDRAVERAIWRGRSAPPPYRPLCVVADYAQTESMGSFIQLWGRGSRVHRDKPFFHFLSHAGNHIRHCFLSQHEGFFLDHSTAKWRKKLVEQGVRTAAGGTVSVKCKTCQATLLPGAGSCPNCGGEVGPAEAERPEVEDASRELLPQQPVPDAPRPPTPHELEEWFKAEALRLRGINVKLVRGGSPPMKPGVLIYRYREKFRRDPPWDVYNRVVKDYGLKW